MDLIPLCCSKCGASLNFSNAFICKCGSCGTPHAMVSDDNLLRTVSFFPLPVADGKMTISLKLQIVKKLREEKKWIPSSDCDLYDRTIFDKETGEVLRFDEFNADYDTIYIRKYSLEKLERPSVKSIFSFMTAQGEEKEKKYYYSPHLSKDLCTVRVIPVEVVNGDREQLIGHRVVISVSSVNYESEGNEISSKIQEWFGVVPDVRLKKI